MAPFVFVESMRSGSPASHTASLEGSTSIAMRDKSRWRINDGSPVKTPSSQSLPCSAALLPATRGKVDELWETTEIIYDPGVANVTCLPMIEAQRQGFDRRCRQRQTSHGLGPGHSTRAYVVVWRPCKSRPPEPRRPCLFCLSRDWAVPRTTRALCCALFP